MTPDRVGTYEIARVIARGGMSVVYLARQPALDREVALKRLDLESRDPSLARRFVQEARLAASLDHVNIVTLFDFFESDGVPYIAMEYLGGGSLRRSVSGLDLPQVFGVLEGVLGGLTHAESRGISHRDLKPENVLVTARGGVKIADFGIARAYSRLTGPVTGSGIAMGTPAYMAPEQVLNAPLGPPTDLYAVGILAYEMLAGRPPFEADDTPINVLYRHVHEPVPPLEPRAPRAPSELCVWVEGLLAKAPADRPASASAAWRALEEIAVDTLGPYWRRDSLLAGPTLTPVADPTPVRRTTGSERSTLLRRRSRTLRPRRAFLIGVPVAVVASAGIAAALVAGGDSAKSPPGSPSAQPRAGPAAPFDFDGDGKQEVAVGLPSGSPEGMPRGSGVVLVLSWRAGKLARPLQIADRVDRPEFKDGFGAAVASGDFDRDGHADLAIGAPLEDLGDHANREGAVTVVYGSDKGIVRGRTRVLDGPGANPVGVNSHYGEALAAGDIDRDGYDDLMIGIPGTDVYPRDVRGSGTIEVVRGGKQGIDPDSARRIRRPQPADALFGSVLAVGDVNHDRHLDLVEASPPVPEHAHLGHHYVCLGGSSGPGRCRPLAPPGSEGGSALAVGDVTGDKFDDIVEGAPLKGLDGVLTDPPGILTVWRGTRRGSSATPVVISQDAPDIPGIDEPGDLFGSAIVIGDLDRDGFGDMLTGKPGDDDGAGAITVIRGSPSTHATVGNSHYDQSAPGIPGIKRGGRRFGTALTLLDVDGDERLDLVTALPASGDIRAGITVTRGGRDGLTTVSDRFAIDAAAGLNSASDEGAPRLGAALGTR